MGAEAPLSLAQNFLNEQILVDAYGILAAGQEKPSDRVCLINVPPSPRGRVDRRLLAEVIRRCVHANAAAIGVDVFLEGSAPGDQELAASLEEAGAKVVLVVPGSNYTPVFPTEIKDLPLKTGVGNFLVTSEDAKVRRLRLWWDAGRQRESLSVAILRAAGWPGILKDLPSEVTEVRLHYPKFPQDYFPTLEAQAVLEAENLDLTNQLVLIGDARRLAEAQINLVGEDTFLTPRGLLRGIYVHAVAVETLLAGNAPRTLAELLGPPDWRPLLTFLLLLCPLVFLDLIFRHLTTLGQTFLFLGSTVVMFLLAGYGAYIRFNLILPVAGWLLGACILSAWHWWRLFRDVDKTLKKLDLEKALFPERLKKLDLFEPLNDLESSLRWLAAILLQRELGNNWEEKVLKNSKFQKRAEEWRRIRDSLPTPSPAQRHTILNALTLEELRQLIMAYWDLFSQVFDNPDDKIRLFENYFAEIRKVRNLVYHNNWVSDDEREMVKLYCRAILKPIYDFQTNSAANSGTRAHIG